MVIFRPSRLQAVTFLDEAEDQIEGDWEVGPDDVEGWPQEIYECLENLMWKGLGDPDDKEEYSDKLIASTKELISKYELDDERITEMCVKTRVTYTDGAVRWLQASPDRLATTFVDFDIGVDHVGSTMLHLDDEGGDHSIFLSLDFIARLEFPLLALKRGIENQQTDDADDAKEITTENTRSTGRKSKQTR
jgi:hypothetical protein